MTEFSDAFIVAVGPRVQIRVGITAAEIADCRRRMMPVPRAVELTAILDTGAECSCIDRALARQLGLPLAVLTLANAPGIGQSGASAQREAELAILHPSADTADELRFEGIELLELDLRSFGYQALIGRDILAKCEFHYNGPAGTFTLSY